MTDIKLFGGSNPSADYFKRTYKNYLNKSNLKCFSRSCKEDIDVYVDLESYYFPKELHLKNETIFISFAPIWLFVPYFKNYLNKFNDKNIKALIIVSSTSVITKKYAWSSFDKKLALDLHYWEQELIKLTSKYNFRLTLIRPSIIYGNIGLNEDKNISLLIKLMKKLIFIPIPKKTGIRQPIHYSQLVESIYKICNSYINSSSINFQKRYEILNIGGDEEFSYEEMLRKIKSALPKNNIARYCVFIKIPNRIFFLFCSPVILISPRYYEAILRISSNMGDYQPSFKISGNKQKLFPLKV